MSESREDGGALARVLDQTRAGRLYPGVILHGADDERRLEAAREIARTLLCEVEPSERPCGACRQCRRIVLPSDDDDRFHPDFVVLERDLRTSTSADAVRRMLRAVQLRPFEGRGQVFVVASAETLTGGAANALLKNLEEPPTTAPRHFLLCAPSAVELLPTLRSRSLSVYLGGADRALEEDAVASLVWELATCIDGYASTGSASYLLAMSRAAHSATRWDDPRAMAPWNLVAAAVLRLGRDQNRSPALRRALLELSEALLEAIDQRVRGVPAQRILDGAISRCLSPVRPA